jgi:hypothetical protein
MLTIKQRHEMQQDVAIYNTINNLRLIDYLQTRNAMARNMRATRKLKDSELRRIVATLPA